MPRPTDPVDSADLKLRVQARDRLLEQARSAGEQLSEALLPAIGRGELDAAELAAREHERQLRELGEDLRIYQAELHAQADELASSQARTAELLERFAALFGGMPVAAMLVAHNGEVLEHNGMAEQALQLRPRAGSARFMHRLVDSDHFQASVRPAFLQAQAGGTARVERLVFMGEQGRRFVGELHIARLPGRADADCSFACAVIDRSEHQRTVQALEATAEALRQSEGFLADAARVARTGGWELTLWPRQMRWSPQLRQVLELPPELPATLEALLGLCERHDRAVLAGAVAAAERGVPFEIELDMVSGAAGQARRMLAVGHAEHDGQRVARVHGVLQDISTQHGVRRQLGDLSDRMAMANDAGGIGVWDCDLRQGTLVFDERMQQLLGGSEPAPGAGLLAALAPRLLPDSAALLRQALDAAVQRLEPLNLELHLDHGPGGPEHWLHLTGRAHPDAHGRAVRLLGCAWDSSPQHEALRLLAAKDAAENASRAKSAFLSRMSHELRTPLNAILGFSQLMRLEAESGDLVLKPHRVHLIESAARHLLELVNEVLDVSRIEAGRVQVELGSFALREVLDEALMMVQGAAAEAGVSLHLTVDDGVPGQVLADRLRLKEVLINLLSNAVKYNQRGGRVRLVVSLQRGQVLVQVADTGRGLDEQQVAGLFQPFNRVGAEASAIQGSGMGLFVSQRYMELMGGRIEVQSQPGAGTTFSLKLHTPPLS